MTIEERIEALESEVKELRSLVAPSKEKKKKERKPKFSNDISFSDYVETSFEKAKKSVEKKLDVKTPVTLEQVMEKCQADESFMGNWQEWKNGDNGKRPTIYFENGYGLKQVQFGKAETYANKFKKKEN